MWTPRSRDSSISPSADHPFSVRAMARNFSTSSQSSQNAFGGYESDRSSDTAPEELPAQSRLPTVPPMWRQQDRLSQKLGNIVIQGNPLDRSVEDLNQVDEDARSRASTLAGDEQDYEFPEKTPTAVQHVREIDVDAEDSKSEAQDQDAEQEMEELPAPHVPGPLEQQLLSLMSKVMFLERENPTIAVSPEEYRVLQDRVTTLEAEKLQWNKRHEALFVLRDADVENNIKVRGLLAKERYDHEAMKKLRDDDLANVLVLRSKLAEATRRPQRVDGPSPPSSAARGSSTPRERPRSIVMERRDTSNEIFQAARNAALEQRALELEKANEALTQRVAEVRKIEIANEKAWQRALELEKENRTLSKENVEMKKDRVSGDKAWRAVVDGLQERLVDARKTEIAGQKAWQRGMELEKEHQKLANEIAEMKRDRVVGDKAWRAVIGSLDEKLKTQPGITGPLNANGPVTKPIFDKLPAISHPASWSSLSSTPVAPTASSSSIQATAPVSAIVPTPPSAPASAVVNGMPPAGPSNTLLIKQVEAVHEENAILRERMSQRVQRLRSEKEALQREVHAREDDHADLERKMARLEKRVNTGCLVCGN